MGAPKKPSSTRSKRSQSNKSHQDMAPELDDARLQGIENARKLYAHYFAKSSIADNSAKFPKFDRDQLKLGKILGKGGFGTVYEVKQVYVNGKGEKDERQFISEHCVRESGDCRYAIKVLSEEVVSNTDVFVRGTLDMAIETRVLSDTEHPNIVKARAVATFSPFEQGQYFIMMDRLYDTLEGRIEKWRKKAARLSGLGGKLFDRQGTKKRDLWEERLVAAFDLSDALGYLHSKKIVYRDLKPENVGFDIRGDVKLFDFGLAAELLESRKDVRDLYKLTGMTGSPRYMSPEVANEESYNQKCDIYSFAVLLWHMLSLKTPYELYTMSRLRERVWNGEHKRPFLDPTWPEVLQTMLRRSWSKEIIIRPTFPEITESLRNLCVEARGGDEEGLEHSKRRSTFVFSKNNMRVSELSETEKVSLSDMFSVHGAPNMIQSAA